MSRSLSIPTNRSFSPTGSAPKSSFSINCAASCSVSSGEATRTSRVIISRIFMVFSSGDRVVDGARDNAPHVLVTTPQDSLGNARSLVILGGYRRTLDQRDLVLRVGQRLHAPGLGAGLARLGFPQCDHCAGRIDEDAEGAHRP